MIPTILHIGPIPIHSFGLMLVLALIAAWWCYLLQLRTAGLRPELAEPIITWAGIGGVLGARIGYLVSFPNELIQDPLGTIFGGAGFVFYWGLIGGVIACWWLLRREKESFLRYADLSGPALAIGYAIGRIGCQLSGDGDYGGPSTLPWAMGYPLGVVPTSAGVLVHPAPVYETLGSLVIAMILLQPALRRKFSGAGQMFGVYFVLAAVERFMVEFVRIEPVILAGLTQAQIIALGSCAAGMAFVVYGNRRPYRDPL